MLNQTQCPIQLGHLGLGYSSILSTVPSHRWAVDGGILQQPGVAQTENHSRTENVAKAGDRQQFGQAKALKQHR